MKPQEKKSTPRLRLARAKRPSANTNVEVSGGANLEAENVQIGGDVVGRDKIVSTVEGDITNGDHNFKVNNNYGTIAYTIEAKPQVRPRAAVAQPPRAPRGFVDREAELARLGQWIAANEAVTVFAPDGEGKSALLEQAATRDAARAMPNGVVPVKGIDEQGEALGLNDVIQRLFDALFESDPLLKANATNARTDLSNTRPLVIFDGLNLPATSVETLVNLIPKGALLFTATHLPAGNATQPLQLGPLPREEAIGLLAVRASLTLDDATRPALEALCAALEDMPLAILIAADVMRVNSLPLERARALITSAAAQPDDPIPDGIKRTWALLRVSLSDDERQVLAAAAASPGMSVDPEWLRESLGNAEWADAAIERLKAMGLLHANSPRLRVDPGLRDLARTGADEIALKDRLIDYFKTTLETRSLDWDYCAAELGNILGTIEWAANRRRWSDVIALSRAIDPYLTLHGLWEAWQTILNRVLQAARAIGDQANEAWALHQLGTQAIGVEQTGQAIDFLRQALDLRRTLGDTIGMAYTQHNLDQIIPPLPPVKPNDKPPASGGALKSLLLKIMVIGAALVGGLFLWGLLANAFSLPAVSPIQTPTSQLSLIATPTAIPTDTPTPTSTSTPTRTQIAARTFQVFLPMALRLPTPTPTATATPSRMPTRRPPTRTPTPTPTLTPTIPPLIPPSGQQPPPQPPQPPTTDTTGPSISGVSASPSGIWYGSGCGQDYSTIQATVTDPSGVSKVEVIYHHANKAWQSAVMSPAGRNVYRTNISASENSDLFYYVQAWDTRNNRADTRTLIRLFYRIQVTACVK